MIEDAKSLEHFIKAGDYDTIYFDLDGVCANFNRAYYIESGLKAEDDPSKVWSIIYPWVRDDAFFCGLWPINETVGLVHRLEREGYNIQILTACGPEGSRIYEDVIEQKKYWCNKYLKGIPQNFVQSGTDKARDYAKGKKSLLIDDQLKNIQKFIEYGGSGVYYLPDYGYLEI